MELVYRSKVFDSDCRWVDTRFAKGGEDAAVDVVVPVVGGDLRIEVHGESFIALMVTGIRCDLRRISGPGPCKPTRS